MRKICQKMCVERSCEHALIVRNIALTVFRSGFRAVIKIYLPEADMDVRVNDILVMKKNHPCGSNTFLVLRSGMDFKLRCCGCDHEIMLPRKKAEKSIRKIIRNEESEA